MRAEAEDSQSEPQTLTLFKIHEKTKSPPDSRTCLALPDYLSYMINYLWNTNIKPSH